MKFYNHEKAQKVTHQVINRIMKESRKEGKLIVMQKQINSYGGKL